MFLVVASGVAVVIGESTGHTDGLAIWAPALFVTGSVSIAIGILAGHRG